MRGLRAFPLLFAIACGGTEPGGPTFATVAAGPHHTCALTVTGVAWCWGSNASGRLGDGTTATSDVPIAVEGSLRFSQITTGFGQTCAVRDNGSGFCWGENGNGELGDGTTTDRLFPTAVAGGLTFSSISTGEGATCGLTASDSGLYCWGVDIGGGVNAPPRDHLRPARYASGKYIAVSMGYEIACALRADGSAVCWGYGSKGQLGDWTFTTSDIPVQVDQSASGPFRAVSTGHDHSCATDLGGGVWCWGGNLYGQLGAVTAGNAGTPVEADSGSVADSAAAHSAGHTCVQRGTVVRCWGNNSYGQLGDGGQPGGAASRSVAGGIAFRQVSTGFTHTCGIDTGGALWCWGSNTSGLLGTGDTTSTTAPVRVALP